MVEKSTRFITQHWKLLLLAAALGLILLLVAGVFISRRVALAAPSQPIAFSHQTHAENGIECLYCHPNVMRSDIAGIPSVQKCVGCHQFIATERDEIQRVLGYWERGEAIPWNRVHRIPDHSYFSHQPHLLSGESCETCHGEVSQMTVSRPVVIMDMGWCLNCHLDQPEERVAILSDCLTCHQ